MTGSFVRSPGYSKEVTNILRASRLAQMHEDSAPEPITSLRRLSHASLRHPDRISLRAPFLPG